MNINLTERHERYIARKVESGAYASPEEVVREGLRLLEAHEERQKGIAWLRSEVEKGFTGTTSPWSKADSEMVREIILKREARSNN
jgi:putative addiction module CopG family antidote